MRMRARSFQAENTDDFVAKDSSRNYTMFKKELSILDTVYGTHCHSS